MKTLIIALMLVFFCSATKKGVGCSAGCSSNTINEIGASWWYNWDIQPHISSAVPFLPMVYSVNRVGTLPAYTTHLLGFN